MPSAPRFAVSSFAVIGLLADPATAGEALRVLSLSAAGAPAIQSPAPQSAPPVWRTTFGSERKTLDKKPASPLGVEADVVLLQDVTNLLQLRRAFPAKSWRLIVSRQMVITDDPLDPRSYEAVSKNPATVVAVRFQPGVRVAGQEHLMDLAARPLLAEAAKVTGAPELSAAPLVAGTAVRLNIGGNFAWVISASFDESCGIPGPSCPQRTRLNTWIDQRRKMGEAVITGGLLRESTAAGMDCAAQSVSVYAARDGVLTTTSAASRRDGMGCAAYADAGGG
jgi:hypothetical protein